jgi:hypothetical protein
MEAPESEETEELVDPERVEIDDFEIEDDADAWRE